MQTNGVPRITDYVALAIIAGVTCRLSCSVNPYSGEGQPPMYGDYEAQRHWMEITVALPPTEWYTNSTLNDLQYWGLDYPPLTAYHSWIVGQIANFIDPAFVSPMASRGFESKELKTFMRSSVFIADLVFLSSVLIYYYFLCKRDVSTLCHVGHCLFIMFLYPPLILIDHGHFQYNCISLGLTVFAVIYLFNARLCVASFLFSLALNYKQMTLYYALPFFVFILRACYGRRNIFLRFKLFAKVSLTVLMTFSVLWLPYLNVKRLAQLLTRLFPVARGIFEDKVGNVWCAVNVIYKLNQNFEQSDLVKLCAFCTLIFSIPSLICLALRPTQRQFLLSLINVSFSFFLFSFHVHEKTILFVALPVLLYMHLDLFVSCWFLAVSHVSLLHLAVKDNILLPYSSLFALFITFLLANRDMFKFQKTWEIVLLLLPTTAGFIGLTWAYSFVKPPPRYPDLWPLLVALYSCVHFVGFFLYFNFRQITLTVESPLPKPQVVKRIKKRYRRRKRPVKVIRKQSLRQWENFDVQKNH